LEGPARGREPAYGTKDSGQPPQALHHQVSAVRQTWHDRWDPVRGFHLEENWGWDRADPMQAQGCEKRKPTIMLVKAQQHSGSPSQADDGIRDRARRLWGDNMRSQAELACRCRKRTVRHDEDLPRGLHHQVCGG